MSNLYLVLIAAWFFMLGCAMGSFYNVLIDRLPNDQDVIKDRSRCGDCGTVLQWKDLIPVFSYLALRGRCRYCQAKLSPQYLFSELSVGSLFVLAFLVFYGSFGQGGGVSDLVINLALWSMLYVVAVMDFKFGIIIDQVLIAFSLIGIVAQFVAKRPPLQMLYGAIAGFLLYGAVYLAARIIYKKEGFGFGDVLLLAAIGTFLGPVKVVITGFLAFYCSILYLLLFKLIRKGSLKDTPIPFAPPLCTAAFIMSLYGNEIAAWLQGYLGFNFF